MLGSGMLTTTTASEVSSRCGSSARPVAGASAVAMTSGADWVRGISMAEDRRSPLAGMPSPPVVVHRALPPGDADAVVPALPGVATRGELKTPDVARCSLASAEGRPLTGVVAVTSLLGETAEPEGRSSPQLQLLRRASGLAVPGAAPAPLLVRCRRICCWRWRCRCRSLRRLICREVRSGRRHPL
jgi:hypothetical protein